MNKESLITTKGADPELMIIDRATGVPVSAINILRRDKHDPIDLGDGIRCYHDNALLEFSFPPAYSNETFIAVIRSALERLKDLLGNKYWILPKSAHKFPKAMLEDPLAWMAGCDPNFCAYTDEENPAAKFVDGTRTGSSHLHIGNVNYKHPRGLTKLLTEQSRIRAIRIMDIFVGCASVLMDRDPTSVERRKLYGKAGEFRPTPYGIEYRVLSPYFLSHPKLVEIVTQLADYAMKHLENDTDLDVIAELDRDSIVSCINNNNAVLAKAIIRQTDIPESLMKALDFKSEQTLEQAWALS